MVSDSLEGRRYSQWLDGQEDVRRHVPAAVLARCLRTTAAQIPPLAAAAAAGVAVVGVGGGGANGSTAAHRDVTHTNRMFRAHRRSTKWRSRAAAALRSLGTPLPPALLLFYPHGRDLLVFGAPFPY